MVNDKEIKDSLLTTVEAALFEAGFTGVGVKSKGKLTTALDNNLKWLYKYLDQVNAIEKGNNEKQAELQELEMALNEVKEDLKKAVTDVQGMCQNYIDTETVKLKGIIDSLEKTITGMLVDQNKL